MMMLRWFRVVSSILLCVVNLPSLNGAVAIQDPPLETYSSAFASTDLPTEDGVFYHNLVLEGGGSKAISYVGALHALARHHYYTNNAYTFHRIGGTSSGCLVGLMVSLDIAPMRLEELVYAENMFESIVDFDASLIQYDLNPGSVEWTSWYDIVRYSYNLLSHVRRLLTLWRTQQSPGLSGEHRLASFIKHRVVPLSPHAETVARLLGPKDITQLTFAQLTQLTGHQLVCYATRITDHTLVEFGLDRTPHMSIVQALYASLAIPGVFKPLDDGQGGALVDGAFLLNFPITMNDAEDGTIDDRTLGLSLSARVLCPYSGHIKTTPLPLASKRHQPDSFNIYNQKCSLFSVPETEGDSMCLELATAAVHQNAANDATSSPPASPPFVMYQFDSAISYATALYATLVNREVSLYERCQANRNRVIYLESPIRMLDVNVSTPQITLAINRAYRNTVNELNRVATAASSP